MEGEGKMKGRQGEKGKMEGKHFFRRNLNSNVSPSIINKITVHSCSHQASIGEKVQAR